MVQVERGLFWYKENCGVFQGSLGLGVQVEKRFLRVVAYLLIKLLVILFFEL